MSVPKVFESEYKLCCIVWERCPIGSGELVKLAEERLGWKKSTTYTVIKKLCERGVLKTENAVVSALISKEEIQRAESREFLDKTFDGSLPAFIAAFVSSGRLSAEDARSIRRMIEQWGDEDEP